MIKLPSLGEAFNHENDFFLSCKNDRIAKFISHFKFLEKVANIEGEIVECGVFKGVSLTRFAAFREILKLNNKKIIGFDTFNSFPETSFKPDLAPRKAFIEEAGKQSISKDQLLEILNNKNSSDNVELIEGDICETIPEYSMNNPGLKICLLNLDVDIYEPSLVILENLYNKITKGGILILDDYNKFPGETKAVNDFIESKNITVQDPFFNNTPFYIIKK